MIQAFLEVMGTFGSGFLTYLILEAAKYGKQFNFKVFWDTNLKPILWSVIGSIAVAAFAVFLPGGMPFIEQTVGEAVDITSYTGLMISGTIIGGIIKSFFGNQKRLEAKSEE
jgi:predicted permease